MKDEYEGLIDDVLIRLWDDIVNRTVGKKMFSDTIDILEARTRLLKIVESARRESQG